MSIALLLEDLFKGTRTSHFLREYKKCLSLTPDEIREFQNNKLRRLVSHLFMNIPWYSANMKRIGLKIDDIRSVEDIHLLPILTRDVVREQVDDLMFKNYRGKVFAGSSSGTTGIPVKYFKDVNALSADIAAGPLLFGLSGWKIGMRTVHVWGNLESVKRWKKVLSILKQWTYVKKNIPSVLINDPEKIEGVVDKIKRFRPVAIDGYANSIYELASFIEKNHISIPSLKMIFTTAENLEPHFKKLIENVMAPVSDMYGCGEINGIAGKPIHDDKYYIFDPHVIVETLPVAGGDGMSEILVTDLDNYYMPLVRYKIGDMVDEIKKGSASNPFPFNHFTRICGRSSDHVVLPDGKKLFPVNIFGGTLYRKHPSIKRHKVIWNGKKLIFIFETDQSNGMDLLEKDIGLSLKDYKVEYEIRTTNKISPGKSGKYRYFEKEES